MVFTAASTADEVLADHDLAGRRALITGASTGLGEETARALAARGAEVVMAVRDPARGEAAMARIRASVPDARLARRVVALDSLASVRAFTADHLAAGEPLDLLIANAGIMACPQRSTVDGWELQLGTNHLGHVALVLPLLSLLRDGGRVIALSSAAHRFSDVDLEDPNFTRGDYEPWVAYGRSKTANALFALELDRRLDGRAHAFSVHPGGIVTELGRHLTEESIATLMASMPEGGGMEWKTIPQGAATTCWAATAPELAAHGGAYLEDCGIAARTDDPLSRSGVRDYAADPERAAALWTRTEAWLAG
ncbi:MAG: hypothetical protein RL531_743 [Actinomycetota bacterium]|jgi:NAD(P)-dependent dehydrogenase (short-subunit alcohol dehydrogenase family)